MWKKHVYWMNNTFGQEWRDYVLVAMQIGFIIALLPLFEDGASLPAVSSSVMTAIFVTGFVYVYATLALWRTVFFTTILGIEWWAVAYLAWK